MTDHEFIGDKLTIQKAIAFRVKNGLPLDLMLKVHGLDKKTLDEWLSPSFDLMMSHIMRISEMIAIPYIIFYKNSSYVFENSSVASDLTQISEILSDMGDKMTQMKYYVNDGLCSPDAALLALHYIKLLFKNDISF